MRTRQPQRTLATLFNLALLLGACTAARAMSTLVSVTLEPQWPTNTHPGSVVLYSVTVTRSGEGNLVVDLSAFGLPQGVTAAFSQNPVRFTGRTPTTMTSTLILTCPRPTPTDDWPFAVTGTAQRESASVTNQGPQNVTAATQPATGPTLVLDNLRSAGMRLRGQGSSAGVYQVQTTPSLSAPAWTIISSITADGNGRFTFVDTSTAGSGTRFYRTVAP